ncbi:MAG: hypothetical protein WD850_00485 [Candidatus Spechtbacterales bacterium]
MLRIPFYGNFRGKLPRPKKDEQEFGPGKKDLVMCPDCNAVYYDKSWHHSLANYDRLQNEKQLRFEICPADRMRRDHLFEGEVVLENIPRHERDDVMGLLERVSGRAYERDPLDRILSQETAGGTLTIRTSENQLALNLAKQVHRAYKATEMKSMLSEKESPIRVRVRWM